jgi:hypothetical protein
MSKLIVQVGEKTVQRRYRPGSARFSDARPASLADIQAGDQLQALGDRTPEGTVLQAEKIVSGSFRYFPATVVAVSPDNGQLTVRLAEDRRVVEASLAPGSVVRRMRMAPGAKASAIPEGFSPISFADLKPGDAVLVATVENGPGRAPAQLMAIAVIAGVEALLKRSTQEQQEMLGSWDLTLDVEAAGERGGQ